MSALQSSSSSPPRANRSQCHRLLILEDSDDIAEILQEIAQASGYRACRCSDRSQAVAECVRLRPALMLVNLGYLAAGTGSAGKDRGLGLLQSLADQRIESHIIIVSANPDSVREAFVNAGLSLGLNMVGHFGKPFDVDELHQKLLELQPSLPE